MFLIPENSQKFNKINLFLETIRKFLETNKSEVIILCVEPYEVSIYEVLAPLYFPRNLLEETSALCQLPKHTETTAASVDQQIRITRNPQHNIMIHGKRKLWRDQQFLGW